ncbi:hypothetical protein [uncultured Pantoea sp.]|uniref:phage neck terminator protein n=1 Tax=uncultured Pantoea sp. TaxID=218084 RepID=UPI0025FD5042|nr:hypothetical protein [uncultured Pantoea sp.]
MSNDSTQPGYLTPLSAPQDYDEPLERELSRWVKALSGLPDGMVRPRWTPVQAAMPAQNVNWCGFGIIGFTSDGSPAFVQSEDDAQMWRHEVVECIASFYGPSSQQTASLFRDGMQVPQNNVELNRYQLSFFDASPLTSFPELINNQWVRRYDVTVRLRRKVVREYGIKSIVDGNVTISTGE